MRWFLRRGFGIDDFVRVDATAFLFFSFFFLFVVRACVVLGAIIFLNVSTASSICLVTGKWKKIVSHCFVVVVLLLPSFSFSFLLSFILPAAASSPLHFLLFLLIIHVFLLSVDHHRFLLLYLFSFFFFFSAFF